MQASRVIRNKYFLLLLRIALGGIFIWASLDKIAKPEAFSTAIRNYMILPMVATNFVAVVLPWIEIVCGVLLIVGFKVRSNAFVLSGLMLIFNVALVIALARGLNISCGCFDVEATEAINGWYLLRDWSLLAAGIVVLVFGRQSPPSVKDAWPKV